MPNLKSREPNSLIYIYIYIYIIFNESSKDCRVVTKKKKQKKGISNKPSCKQYKHILSLLFERRWIQHMLGVALHKIMYRQPLP